MILTVTPNTALDRVYFLERLERNRRNQACDALECMGGKGCNVSLVLRELGEETVATGLAAGGAGRRMEALLRAAGVVADFAWTEGETRVNSVLLEREGNAHTTVCSPGIRAGDEEWEALVEWIDRWGPAAAVIVLAGSLPDGWSAQRYRELAAVAARYAPVVADASGAALAQVVKAGVQAVKPNQHELESLFGPLPGTRERHAATRRLLDAGVERVLLSRGAEGAELVTRRGVLAAPGLEVPVVNPAGAGDGMTACLALALQRGWDDEQTLRCAMAVSAAVVMTRGTAELRGQDVETLLPRVRIAKVPAEGQQ